MKVGKEMRTPLQDKVSQPTANTTMATGKTVFDKFNLTQHQEEG